MFVLLRQYLPRESFAWESSPPTPPPSFAAEILIRVEPKLTTEQCYIGAAFPSPSSHSSPPMHADKPLLCPCAAVQLPHASPHHPTEPSPPKPSRAQPAASELIGGSDNVGIN